MSTKDNTQNGGPKCWAADSCDKTFTGDDGEEYKFICDGYDGAACTKAGDCSTELKGSCADLYKHGMKDAKDHSACYSAAQCETTQGDFDVVCGGTMSNACMGKDDKPCSTILGLQCFDWQQQDGSKSNGLKCGDSANCGKNFTYSQQPYMGMCDGLTGSSCAGDAHCD